MEKRFLITTAEESTWLTDKPIIFLGEWCRLYGRKNLWERLDAEVVAYHWDDREKYYQDYCYLQNVYEETLKDTSKALNTFHGTNYSVRFWRILIGPWLFKFINTLFDRWVMVQKVTQDYSIDGTIILKQSEYEVIPYNMHEYISIMWDDKWNNHIIGEIIKKYTDINWVEKDIASSIDEKYKSRTEIKKSSLKQLFIKKIGFFLGKFTHKNEIFIMQSYLPIIQEFLFQIYLGQFPKLWTTQITEKCHLDLSKRKLFKIHADSKDAFILFSCDMIQKQIPITFLEGYNNLVYQIKNLPWPSQPKVIFTSNAYEHDEVFKLWAAIKTESGIPLVIGQHGGFFGVGKWVVGEDHQVAISDRFLTWGWTDSRESVFPALAFVDVNQKQLKWKKDGDLLFITVPIPRYSWKSSSWPVAANQSNQLINTQLRFAELLPVPIRESLVIRLLANFDKQQKTSYVERIKDTHPEIKIDSSIRSIELAVSNCRIFLSGYNATTYLYSLSRNIPTIMFWEPDQWELREDAKPFFEKLKQVGVFHETPESASSKVKEIWDDVEGWWYQKEIQEVRREFCQQYAYMPNKPFHSLKKALSIQ